MQKDKLKYIIKTTAILVIITALTAVLLAAVNAITKDAIAENDRKATEQSLEVIFGEGISFTDITDKFENLPTTVTSVLEITGKGYAILVAPEGFKDKINMAVGISDGVICGVSVISSSETSGIGSKAANDDYVAGYVGISGQAVLGEDIEAVSGATISSKAILKGINDALSVDLSHNGGEENEK